IGYATFAVSVSRALPQPTPAASESAEDAFTAPPPWDPHVLREPWITEDPEAGFAFVHIWQQYGHPFPDALLKKLWKQPSARKRHGNTPEPASPGLRSIKTAHGSKRYLGLL